LGGEWVSNRSWSGKSVVSLKTEALRLIMQQEKNDVDGGGLGQMKKRELTAGAIASEEGDILRNQRCEIFV